MRRIAPDASPEGRSEADPALRQVRETGAQGMQRRQVDFGGDHALAFGDAAKHLAPGADDHRMTPGLATAGMNAGFAGREHIDLILDRPCPQQDFPVRDRSWR